MTREIFYKKTARSRREWTDEQDEFLKQNAHNYTVTQLMEKTGATRTQIEYKCKQLCLSPIRRCRRLWTVDEIQFLEKFAHTKTLTELERFLPHAVVTIRRKCNELGVKPKGYVKKNFADTAAENLLPIETVEFIREKFNPEIQEIRTSPHKSTTKPPVIEPYKPCAEVIPRSTMLTPDELESIQQEIKSYRGRITEGQYAQAASMFRTGEPLSALRYCELVLRKTK